MITYPCRNWSKSRVRSFGSLPGTLKVHVHWYFRRCVLLANVFVTILSKMHLFSLKTRKVPFSNEVVLDGQRRKSPLFTNHIQLVCLYKSQILLYIILVCVCAGNRDFARLYQSMSWWRHQMETFSALLALCGGIHCSPVNSPHKDQWSVPE